MVELGAHAIGLAVVGGRRDLDGAVRGAAAESVTGGGGTLGEGGAMLPRFRARPGGGADRPTGGEVCRAGAGGTDLRARRLAGGLGSSAMR